MFIAWISFLFKVLNEIKKNRIFVSIKCNNILFLFLLVLLLLLFSFTGGDLIPSIKYEMSETPINEYSLQMDLNITSLEPRDFGGYLCIAKNALGKAEGSIRLQGMLNSVIICTVWRYIINTRISYIFLYTLTEQYYDICTKLY